MTSHRKMANIQYHLSHNKSSHTVERPQKRPRCDDDEFYSKWLRFIEEKENTGFAVFCNCSIANVHKCKCNSIIHDSSL
jgi:hypothetical protein